MHSYEFYSKDELPRTFIIPVLLYLLLIFLALNMIPGNFINGFPGKRVMIFLYNSVRIISQIHQMPYGPSVSKILYEIMKRLVKILIFQTYTSCIYFVIMALSQMHLPHFLIYAKSCF